MYAIRSYYGQGNERVLVSRLDDAAFYWHEDTRAKLEDKVDSLRNVVWLEGLGSLYEKTERNNFV